MQAKADSEAVRGKRIIIPSGLICSPFILKMHI